MKYLHSMVRVRDLAASLRFYCEGLGLREVRRKDVPQGKFTLVFLAAPEDVPAAGEQLDVLHDDVRIAREIATHLVESGPPAVIGDVDAGHVHGPTLGRGVAHLGG